MIYILYFTFWLTTGNVIHSSYEAHVKHKVVTQKEVCERLAREAQHRMVLADPNHKSYTKVTVECQRVNRADYFSRRHHLANSKEAEDNEIYQKRKRKSRSHKKSRLE